MPVEARYIQQSKPGGIRARLQIEEFEAGASVIDPDVVKDPHDIGNPLCNPFSVFRVLLSPLEATYIPIQVRQEKNRFHRPPNSSCFPKGEWFGNRDSCGLQIEQVFCSPSRYP